MDLELHLAGNATYTLHAGDIVAFAEISRSIAQVGRASSGCVYFRVAQDVEDNSQFHLIEGWTDQAAADAFNQSEAFQKLLSKAMNLRLLGRSGILLEVSNAKPLQMPGESTDQQVAP